MAWTVQKIETRKLTAALIDEFVTMTRLPNDRELKPRRLAFLKSEVEAKRFRTAEWASAFCKETQQTYRINGKHTSTLFSQMNGKRPDATIVVERYECDTLRDAAELYSTFDSKDSARSSHEINMAFAASIPQLREVTGKVVDICVSAMSFALHELGYGCERATDRAERLETEYQFVAWSSQFVAASSRGGRGHLSRAPVVAAMYLTYKKDKAAAAKFWTLARDASAEVKCPTRKLERYLLTSALRRRDIPKGVIKAAGVREMFVKCIHAWNAWRAGESTDLRYFPDVDTPKLK